MAAVCQCHPAGPSSDTSPSDPAGVESSIYADRVGFMSAGLLSPLLQILRFFFVEKLTNTLRAAYPTPEEEADFTVTKAQPGDTWGLPWHLSWRGPPCTSRPPSVLSKRLARAGRLAFLSPAPAAPVTVSFPGLPLVGGGGRGAALVHTLCCSRCWKPTCG